MSNSLNKEEEIEFQRLLAKRSAAVSESHRSAATSQPGPTTQGTPNFRPPNQEEIKSCSSSAGSQSFVDLTALDNDRESADEVDIKEENFSYYEEQVLAKRKIRERFNKLSADQLAEKFADDDFFLKLAKEEAPFLLYLREAILIDRKRDFFVGNKIAQFIQDMFTPHSWVKGETLASRTTAAITRDSWLMFLGKVCLAFFNPVKYGDSGPDTKKIRSNIAITIRSCFFGLDMDVQFTTKDKNGFTEFKEVILPTNKQIEKDLRRKFKYRDQNENLYMSDLKVRYHSSSDTSSPAVSVPESPRKPFCGKGERLQNKPGAKEWIHKKGGRQRRTFEQMMETSVVIKQLLNSSSVEVKITHSPVSKRERLISGSSGSSSGGAIDFTEEASDTKEASDEDDNNRLSGSDTESEATEEEDDDDEGGDLLKYAVSKKSKTAAQPNKKAVVTTGKTVSVSSVKNSKPVTVKNPLTLIKNTTDLHLDDEYRPPF